MEVISINIFPSSLASASFSTGPPTESETITVYCAINGPQSVRLKCEIDDRAFLKCIWQTSLPTFSSTQESITVTPDPSVPIELDSSSKEIQAESEQFTHEKDFEHFIYSILSGMVLTHLFPRSGFLFTFFVLKKGSTSTPHQILACAINALSVALIHSGLPVRYMITASAAPIVINTKDGAASNPSILLVTASNAPRDHVLALDACDFAPSHLSLDTILAQNFHNEQLLERIKGFFSELS